MNIRILARVSDSTRKKYYSLEWGKGLGQRMATGIYTYTRPKDQIQKAHNKEALVILETKRSQMVLDQQAISSGYVPIYKLKSNFLDFYKEFVKLNTRKGNRHLQNSLNSFKAFLKRDYISPIELTENLCERFRNYLLTKYNGETPSGYFMRFKRVLKAAKKDGYFRTNPGEDVAAKSNSNRKIKEILSETEYVQLMNAPCLNYEVKKAFVFSLYTGLRWTDIKPLVWENIQNDMIILRQKKTGQILELPLHHIAIKILGERKSSLVFHLPTQDGANKILGNWCDDAQLKKHITWHCARHSFSVLLQQKGVDLATVAGMLGHTSTKYVQQTYRRYIKTSAVGAIQKLPSMDT